MDRSREQESKIAARPTLAAWLAEYDAIEREYIASIEATGARFAERGAHAEENARLRDRLRDQGAVFLHGGSSIHHGFFSSACAACVGDAGSRTFFISLRCNRDCYFCFNPNQADYDQWLHAKTPWRDDLRAFAAEQDVTHVALTGGEPLLYPDDAVGFFEEARRLAPGVHARLYTTGVGLDDALATRLADAGLTEIRFSAKLDEGEASVAETLAAIEVARAHIPHVMVEMPVVPGEEDRMARLLRELDERGVDGINLLEMCYPLHNWDEFARRGLLLKNPPFEALYDYGYAGALAVDGSEEACLALMADAIDEGLRLGFHYCSLENKNRDEILRANRAVALDDRLYELGDDCFYHVAKVFDGDADTARAILRQLGAPCAYDDTDGSVSFHPRWARPVANAGALVATSTLVVEGEGENATLRELALKL